MTPDNKIMDYIVGLEKNLLKVKEENERLKDALCFYADPENYIDRKKDSWDKKYPENDSEMIRNYNHPNTDWVGTIVVGGKKAREALSKIGEL